MDREARTITQEEKSMFLALQPDDITKELLDSLFSDHYDVETNKVIPSRFNTYDTFTLKKGEYFNKEEILTNCGLFIYNKYLIEPAFSEIVGYVNTPLDSKAIKAVDAKMVTAVLEDGENKLIEPYIDYLNRMTWLSLTFNTEICASLTLKSVKPLPSITAEKKKLLKENKEAIANKDVHTVVQIYDKLVDSAKEEMKDDPAYELYASGARGAFNNAYRQAQIMKGPVWNDSKGEFDIMTNSLYEGAEKNDLPAMANAVVAGMYPKAIGTGESGYLAKKLMATFQGITLDKKGSDCKSKAYMETVLTNANKNLFMYTYMVQGDKLVRLDESNIDNYIGKKIKYRSPMTHTHGKLCNACAGDRYYMLGIENIGLTSGRVANSILQANMKRSHDTTVSYYEYDIESLYKKL